jgi:hypothetical protein
MTIRGKSETRLRPEWYLWIQNGDWELRDYYDIFCSSRDNRATISEKIGEFKEKNLKLQEIKLPPSCSYTQFMFGNFEPFLMIYSPEWPQDIHAVNWMLFTPTRKVLVVQKGNASIQDENE